MNGQAPKFFIFSLGLILSANALSAELSTSKKILNKETTDLKISLGLGGHKVDSTLNTANVMGVRVGAAAVHDLSETIKVKVNGGMNVQTGSSSTAKDNNIYTPSNSNYLKEALASYTPASFVNLEGGVINQSFLNAPMVVGNKGFIAAKESFNYKIYDTKISLVTTQAIPNNRNLSQKIDVKDEGDPRFYAESLIIEQELFIGEMNLSATHFAYDNISNSVAYRSILLGNSGTPISTNNGVLANDYQGWHGSVDYNFDIDNNSNLEFSGSSILNTAATKNNKGLILGSKYTYTKKQHQFSLEFDNFSIDSDASIAYYNSSTYGMANKKGNRVQFEYKNSDQDLALRAGIIQNELINKNDYQSNETIIILSLRKIYDLF